jgi:23S rRNA (guanosine2251-2'-O)-methyltransferase
MSREKNGRPPSRSEGGGFWLYGLHAVKAALANPRRKIRRAAFTERAREEIGSLRSGLKIETYAPDALAKLLPHGAVHQGAALLCEPLPALDLEDALANAATGPRIVAVLDQITDPHNEGAILRSAAAFGISAVVVQDRHAPEESGALDLLPRVTVVNIARALEELGKLGFYRIALAADGESDIASAAPDGDIALALGAEGTGLRRLVRERCDAAAFIPMSGAMESLNVSNAAAIAFYELRRKKT